MIYLWFFRPRESTPGFLSDLEACATFRHAPSSRHKPCGHVRHWLTSARQYLYKVKTCQIKVKITCDTVWITKSRHKDRWLPLCNENDWEISAQQHSPTKSELIIVFIVQNNEMNFVPFCIIAWKKETHGFFKFNKDISGTLHPWRRKKSEFDKEIFHFVKIGVLDYEMCNLFLLAGTTDWPGGGKRPVPLTFL